MSTPPKAILFVDGSNWYHSLKEAGVTGGGELNFAKISAKLVGPGREWVETRYYVGRVNQNEAPDLYAKQRRFFSHLLAADPRISAHFGRLETRLITNEFAVLVKQYLSSLTVRIDPGVYQALMRMVKTAERVPITTEKAVDVKLAIDIVMLAQSNAYDAAYLLTADGDYTPAVEAVRQLGKRVYVASPSTGAQLAAAANMYIPLKRDWFSDCW